MPMVGLGTWRLSGHDGYMAIRCALDAGYRHIDTATAYRNEAVVGRAVRDSGLDRQEVFITTKLPAAGAGRERETLGESLRALGTEYTDLWLVHGPPRGLAAPAVWREFLSLRSAGMCRAVGVSNYSLAQIDELTAATGEAPAVNQVPWSPSLHDPRLLRALRERGIAPEGYSPLRGVSLDDRLLTGIAARLGVSAAQVVLRWHLEHGVTVIPKSATPERVRANIDLFGFAMSAADMARLDYRPR
jgi:diketogulonate reductase-like aldo/keto reductase